MPLRGTTLTLTLLLAAAEAQATGVAPTPDEPSGRADASVTLTAGPTTLFVMPGIALRLDAALGERLALPVEVHVDGIAGAGRVGLRTGLDLSSAERSLGGWYAGVRVGSWMLAEPAGRTLTLEAGPVVGYRHVTARGLVLQAGTGLLPRLVLAGDHAWSGIVVPALELRAGGRIR